MVQICDAATGKELKRHSVPGSNCVAFSPDGRRLVWSTRFDPITLDMRDPWTGSSDWSVKLPAGLAAVWITPDGKKVVGPLGEVMKTWDAKTGVELQSLPRFLARAFSPDGRRMFGADWSLGGGPGAVYDLATGKRVSSRMPPLAGAAAFAPDGRHVVVGALNGVIHVYRLPLPAATEPPPEPVAASPFDGLKRENIPEYELRMAGNGDAKKVPQEVVAILGDSRLRHGTINALTYRPGGKELATAGQDGVRVWDAATGRQVRYLACANGSPLALAYSPDGGRLAIGYSDGAVQLRDASTGEVLRTLNAPKNAHKKAVASVVFSPDGTRLASSDGANDGAGAGAKIWDAATGKELLTITADGHRVLHLSFSPDGTRLAGLVQGKTELARIWDATTGKGVRTITGDNDRVWFVAFQPHGKWLATGTGSHQSAVEVQDAETGNALWKAPVGWGFSLAYSADGKLLAAGNSAGGVIVWDAGTGKELHKLQTYGTAAVGLAFSPDGRQLARAGDAGEVTLWDLTTGKEILPRGGHPGDVSAVTVSPDGRRIYSAGSDGRVRAWDVATGREEAALDYHVNLFSLAVSPDGGRLAAGLNANLRVWNAHTGTELYTIQGEPGNVRGLAFSPDGRQLASPAEGEVRLRDAATGKAGFSLKGSNAPFCIAFSPDGKLAAAGCENGTVLVWDVATGLEVHRWTANNGVSQLSFSPDGKLLLVSGGFVAPELWDVATGKQVRKLQPMTVPGRALFCNQGRAVVGCDGRSDIYVWDPATGNVLRRIPLPLPIGSVRSVAVAPDGRHLVIGNGNGTVYVLRLEPAAASKSAARRSPSAPSTR
jgi:WD40 repeat protein